MMNWRKHGLLAVAGGLLLVCGAGIAVLHVGVNRWLASEEFRRWASREVSGALGVEGEFLPPRWAQTTVYSEGFAAAGRGADGLSAVRADQVRAQFDLRAVFAGVWRLESLGMGRLRLDLGGGAQEKAGDIRENEPDRAAALGQRLPDADAMARLGGGRSADAPAVARKRGGWDFLSRWVPNRFEVGRVEAESFELRWPAGGDKRGSISGARVVAKPAGRAWEFHGTGGLLRHPGAPDMAVGEFAVRLDWPALYVTSADLRLADGEGGRVALSGEAAFAGERPVDLEVAVEGLPVERFVEGDWRARIKGRFSGRGRVRGPTRGAGGLKAEGDVRVEEGRVEALPVLDEIASLTGTKEFRSMKLDRATARVYWSDGVLALDELWLESAGLLRVNGRVAEERGLLDGELEVGTTPGRLRLLPGARKHVFTREADGYVWAVPAVRIARKSGKFSEDLTPRLGRAVVQEADDRAGDAVRTIIDIIDSLLR